MSEAWSDNPLGAANTARVFDDMLGNKKVIFVTGKGGVGKSAVAAMLALRARERGLAPVLFECDGPTRPSPFPGGKALNDELREVVPGVWAVNQDSEAAVRAYALASIPSKAIADLLFQNRVSRLFLRASPSVNEMALMGRVVQLAEEPGRNGPVIVDLHATGHALAMLRAPDGIMRVLRGGPVYERAKKVRDFIFGTDTTQIVTVALPEELPVTESLEFIDALRDIGAPVGPVVANGVFLDPAPRLSDDVLDVLAGQDPTAPLAGDVRFLRAWAQRASREAARLYAGAKERGLDVVALPFLSDLSPGETLAGRLFVELQKIDASRSAGEAAAHKAAS